MTGTVTSSDAGPLSGIAVRVIDDVGNSIAGDLTNRDGTYAIAGFAAGTWRMSFEPQHPDYSAATTSPLPFVDGVPVVVDQTLQAVPVTPVDGVDIAGVVRDSQGRPAPGVFVRAWARDQDTCGVPSDSDLSDHHGRYDLDDLPPGDYRLQLTDERCPYAFEPDADDMGFAETWSGGATRYADAAPVAVDGRLTAYDVTMPDAGGVTGHVLTRFGTPPGIGEVFVYPVGQSECCLSQVARVRTSPDGSFSMLDLDPGDYRLAFDGYDDLDLPSEVAYPRLWWGTRAWFSTSEPVTVTSGEMTSGIDQVLYEDEVLATPRISGRPRVGRPLEVTGTSWIPSADLYLYSPQWLRGRPAVYTEDFPGHIVGRETVYVPTREDVGHRLSAHAYGYFSDWAFLTGSPDYAYTYVSTTEPVLFGSRISASAAVRLHGRTRQYVEIRVRVHGQGLPRARGQVSAEEGDDLLATRRLVDGRTRFRIQDPTRGDHHYLLRYAGNATTAPSKIRLTVRVM